MFTSLEHQPISPLKNSDERAELLDSLFGWNLHYPQIFAAFIALKEQSVLKNSDPDGFVPAESIDILDVHLSEIHTRVYSLLDTSSEQYPSNSEFQEKLKPLASQEFLEFLVTLIQANVQNLRALSYFEETLR